MVPDDSTPPAHSSPSNIRPNAKHLHALLGSLSNNIVDRATGAALPCGTRLTDDQQQMLWLGMLASEPQLIADAQRGNPLSGKLVPAAQGLSFRIPAETAADVTFTVQAAVFTPLHPSVKEQRESVTGDRDEDDPDDTDDTGTGTSAAGQGQRKHRRRARPKARHKGRGAAPPKDADSRPSGRRATSSP